MHQEGDQRVAPSEQVYGADPSGLHVVACRCMPAGGQLEPSLPITACKRRHMPVAGADMMQRDVAADIQLMPVLDFFTCLLTYTAGMQNSMLKPAPTLQLTTGSCRVHLAGECVHVVLTAGTQYSLTDTRNRHQLVYAAVPTIADDYPMLMAQSPTHELATNQQPQATQ